MQAVMLEAPGQAQSSRVQEARCANEDEILLQVRKIGLCGTRPEFVSRAQCAGLVSARSRA